MKADSSVKSDKNLTILNPTPALLALVQNQNLTPLPSFPGVVIVQVLVFEL